MQPIETFMADFAKRVGRRVVLRASDKPLTTYLSTGALNLDLALLGGVQENSITLIYGDQDCGKTLQCINILKSFQKKYPKKIVLVVDSENHWSPERLDYHGINKDNVYFLATTRLEELADGISSLVDNKELDVGLIIVDSIVNLISTAEFEKSNEDAVMGNSAKAMSRFVKHLNFIQVANTALGKKMTLIFTNQYRMDIGRMFGDKRTLPGGKAPTQAAITHIELKPHKKLQIKELPTGLKELFVNTDASPDKVVMTKHEFYTKKSKTSAPFNTGDFYFCHVDIGAPFNYKLGDIPDEKMLVDYMKSPEGGFIAGSGAGGYTIKGHEGKFKTYSAITQYLIENKDHKLKLAHKALIDARIKGGLPGVPVDGYLYGETVNENSEE